MRYSREQLRSSMLVYAITDRRWLPEGRTLPEVCGEVLDHGATCLQLREKDLDPASLEQEAGVLQQLCARRGVPFIVNDSVEIALSSGADGVHVGQGDIRGRDIRALLGPERILGMSARTVAQARAAEEAGADYLGAGAVFATGTKRDASPLSPDTLRAICRSVSIPVVAIGGITSDNLHALAGTGVAGIAVVSALFAAPDPGRAAEELHARVQAIVRASGEGRAPSSGAFREP